VAAAAATAATIAVANAADKKKFGQTFFAIAAVIFL